jgi:hypothetical protein
MIKAAKGTLNFQDPSLSPSLPVLQAQGIKNIFSKMMLEPAESNKVHRCIFEALRELEVEWQLHHANNVDYKLVSTLFGFV